MDRFFLILGFTLVLLHSSSAEAEGAKNVTEQSNSTSTTPLPVVGNNVTDTETAKLSFAPVNGTNDTVPLSTTAVPTTTLPPMKILNSTSKVVCYYNGLAENRTDALKYTFADVDSSLCSHIIYSYVSVDHFAPPNQNETNFDHILALKEKGIIVMLSVGGRDDPTESAKFSKMVNNGSLRNHFVENVVRFLKHHKFQGLDVNWEYPSCWNGYCKSGRPADKTNFVTLLRELHTAFRFYKLILSVAVSPLESISDKAYDVRGVSNNVDFVNLMAFDYNNQTYTNTAIHAPYDGPAPNVVSTVDYWISKGAIPHKLVLGIPTFGRTFTLEKADWNGPKATSSIGKATGLGLPGTAAYFEVCKGLNYQMREHEGPYAFKEDQWVSFDDIPSVTTKAHFIRKSELGGAMIWSLDTDDFNGAACEQGKYPLIKAVRSGLGLPV